MSLKMMLPRAQKPGDKHAPEHPPILGLVPSETRLATNVLMVIPFKVSGLGVWQTLASETTLHSASIKFLKW